jgi:N-methylhydantoinase B
VGATERPLAILSSDGADVELPHNIMIDFAVKAGDVLTHIQPSAGGYGPPFEREVERVMEDVRDEKLSRQSAAHDYGVVIDNHMRTDFSATSRLRAGET